MKSQAFVRAICAALLLGAVTTTAPAIAQDQDWSQIEADARKAGRVTIYHNLPPPGDEPLFAEFRRAYPGINVEQVRLGSAALMQRFSTEYAAGVSAADVVLTVWDEALESWVDRGWVKQWIPPEASAYPDEYKFKNSIYSTQLYREVIVYNTNRIKQEDAPKEWRDILDPKLSGRIGMNAPWRSVTVQGAVAFWEKNLGIQDVAQKLKQNGVRFFNGSSGVLQAVVRGDVWVGQLIDPPVINALGEGAPIAAVYPKSGVPAIAGQIFVPEKAPSTAAGQVFTNWLLSKEGQTAMQEHVGSPALRPDVAAPKLVPATSELSIVLSPTLLDPDYQKKLVEEFRRAFNVQ